MFGVFVVFQGEKSVNRAKDLSVHLLSLLADSSDWLSLFHQSGSGTELRVWSEGQFSPHTVHKHSWSHGRESLRCISTEQSVYRCVSMVTTDANIRLMPFAFYR